MTLQEPETPDRPAIDSGVHVRDSETAPASGFQITMVAVLVAAILFVFFYGLNSQRQEGGGTSAPAPQAVNVPPPQPSTTGQGGQNAAQPPTQKSR